jgi:sulfur-oxidizing protein SoxX
LLGGVPASAAVSSAVAAGKKLAFDRSMGNCLACHTMKGSDVPSNVGPKLSDIKKKFPNRKKLYAIIYDEEQRNPQTVMPAFGKNLILTPQQINQIIDFLYTR